MFCLFVPDDQMPQISHVLVWIRVEISVKGFLFTVQRTTECIPPLHHSTTFHLPDSSLTHVWPLTTSIRWSLQVGGHNLHTPVTTPRPLPAVTLCCARSPRFPSSCWKKGTGFVMFPPALTRSLRHKAILSGCRKQSQEMGMHCVTLSATSGYLFGRIFPFFFMGIPFSHFLPGIPDSALVCAVELKGCSVM